MSHIDDRLADWLIGGPHISIEHNRIEDRKGLIMINHPVTKNSAKEEPQNCIKYCSKIMKGKTFLSTFSYLLCFYHLPKYLTLLCCKSNVLK